jgi:site-specific DNA recombinase
MNPRYTGRQVWNRQRRDEILLDVEDVARGHLSRMKWNDRSDWVWSAEQTHEAIIDSETFAAAQAQMAAGSYRPTTGKTRTTKWTCVLSGRVHCGLCGHRMRGNLNHDANHYRSKFAPDRAPVPGLDHPKNVYVRESAIVPKLDALRVLCYRNRTLAASGRLHSQVPWLKPPVGFCSTRPSDTYSAHRVSNVDSANRARKRCPRQRRDPCANLRPP